MLFKPSPSPELRLIWLREIAEWLKDLHADGKVHGAVATQNVIFLENRQRNGICLSPHIAKLEYTVVNIVDLSSDSVFELRMRNGAFGQCRYVERAFGSRRGSQIS
jgi:hypothetical protein